MASKENDIKRNGSGYFDPTAYHAIKNADKPDPDDIRFRKLLETIFNVCELADFHLEGRITVRDKRTGKIRR